MRNRIFVLTTLTIALGVAVNAQTYTNNTLYSFGLSSNDGAHPFGGLVRDSAGNLYGTNWSGGGSLNCSPYDGCGTVFQLDSSGKQTILHAFTGGADGSGPVASLTIDAAGNLYGTTSAGGISTHYAGGAGTAFKITTAGDYSILHQFGGNPSDGESPRGSLTLDRAGNLYGTTAAGGAYGKGTVFELRSNGHETVLYSFRGKADGAYPGTNLLRDGRGNLYGTANQGGAFGVGVMFKLSLRGVITVLHTFCSSPGCADGEYPLYIVRNAQGNFYGSTEYGGNGQGVIFEVDSVGTESTLYAFCPAGVGSGCPDGSGPTRLLASGSDLYGAAAGGGNGGAGLIYKLTEVGVETVLYSFPADYSEGATPVGVIADSAGNLYGTALNGGSANFGLVFTLTEN
jgi:uncharacterized repeat protein (TIGR03803 family)